METTENNQDRDQDQAQAAREREAARAAADAAEVRRQGFDDATLGPELLRRLKARALATGDPRLITAAVKLELKQEEAALSRRRQELLERKALALERAQAELEAARNSKGGLSPETIAKIERELNLM